MMTPDQHQALRRRVEREEMREAIATSHARASIDKLLGEELIAAARSTVREWEKLEVNPRNNRFRGIAYAIRKLEDLVGRP